MVKILEDMGIVSSACRDLITSSIIYSQYAQDQIRIFLVYHR